ncbi:MAG: hypothetical protein ACR2QT_11100 [Woeseiaceae bacterium]
MKRFFNWLSKKKAPQEASPRPNITQSGRPITPASTKQAVPRKQPEVVDLDEDFSGRIEDRGPGKNVLIRNKYIREDTGTHETLTILDDASIESDDEAGIDPYNTGQFDRSRNWDKRFRKD